MTSTGEEARADFAEARAKIAAVSAQIGREVRVFLHPAAVPPPENKLESEDGNGGSATERGEEPDDFYEFTELDYARIMRSRKEEVLLKTKKIRDAEAAASMSRITKAVVRTEFPDGWIVEATFQPSDPITAVREVLQRCLARPELPFYLYTTPPKQRIKDETKSLYSAGLAPGALIHFSHEPPKGATQEQLESLTQGPFLREEVAALTDLHLIPQPEDPPASSAGGEGAATMASGEGVENPVTPAVAASSSRAVGKQPSRPKWFKPK